MEFILFLTSLTLIFITVLPTLFLPKYWLWIKAHRIRVISAAVALLIFLNYSYIIDLVDEIARKSHQPDLETYFNGMVSSVIQNTVFACFVFALFSGTIDRWLGHDVTESARFNPKRFLKKVTESTDSVIIHETYVRVLVQDYKDELIKALKIFFENHLKKYPNSANYDGRIRVLVLHPYGDAIRERFRELEKFVDSNEKTFLLSTRDFLKAMQDIQKEINKYASERIPLERMQDKKSYFFDIRISYAKPKFSFYYCDRYASVSYYAKEPSEDAPQLIFHRDKKGMNPVAEKHKEFFEQDWDQGILLTKTYFNLAFSQGIGPENFEVVVNDFKTITESTVELTIIAKLKAISDICRNNRVFALELINYIEIYHRKNNINFIAKEDKEHFSILGSGGDDMTYRTINISTIVSILASHPMQIDGHTFHISVVKVGTLAVTGIVGSQTFFETLQSKIRTTEKGRLNDYESIPIDKRKLIDYDTENGSTFLPIIYFGYMYRQVLRNARKIFIEQNDKCIDIFKIIFPLANLTGYKASINGVSKQDYLPIYQEIYELKQKTGIILRNDRNIDELFHGTNTILYYKDGREICRYEKKIEIVDVSSYDEFFKEFKKSDHGEVHVKRFFRLFTPGSGITEDIKITICYNIALFVQLHSLVHNEYPITERNKINEAFGESRLDNLMEQIKNSFFKDDRLYLI